MTQSATRPGSPNFCRVPFSPASPLPSHPGSIPAIYNQKEEESKIRSPIIIHLYISTSKPSLLSFCSDESPLQNDNKLGFEADRYKCIIIGLLIFDKENW